MSDDVGLYRASTDVPHGRVPMQVHAGRLETQQVFGLESAMMYARRSAGYHSVPHRHDCEQLNLCISGRMWIFVDDEGYELGPGDFLRVPRSAPHWAWNRGDEDAILVEVHAPGLLILPEDEVAHLLRPDEDRSAVQAVPNEFLPELDVTTVEQHLIGG